MDSNNRQALQGIKVADFTWVAAGPLVTRYLAAHGAEVVKIESGARPDPLRISGPYKDRIPGVDRCGYFPFFNANKYSISLNLNHPLGNKVAKKLIAWADIVTESFATGTMEKWGLGYKEIKKIKPDIIMLRTTNQGQTGPHAKQPGFGQHLVGLSGFCYYTGWPDRDPVGSSIAYTDMIAPRFAAAALIAALDYRRRTGKGLLLDVSQLETGIHFLVSKILDYTVNGRIGYRSGNSCSLAAPHGAYPCQGEDRWCAIAVFSDEEWRNFGKLVGETWIQDPKFVTLLSRKRNENELNKLVSEWTRKFSAEHVMTLMQGVGIAAGIVKNIEDIFSDPQLDHRNSFWKLDHSVLGPFVHLGNPFILSKTPAQPRRPAPCLGEHNEYVCTEILGMSDKEFVDLVTAGAFG